MKWRNGSAFETTQLVCSRGRWATFCGRIEAVRKDSPATPPAAAASAVAAGVCVTTAVVCVALCS